MKTSFLFVLTPLALLAAPLPAQGGVTAVAHVTIAGGPKPGSYVLSVSRGGCSSGATGKGSFGTQISDQKVSIDALGSVQLIVPRPSASGATEFQLVVRFGSLMKSGPQFDINTLSDAKTRTGKGTVSVNDAGATAKVTFDATTAAGVHLVGTVDCKKVIRIGAI